MSNVELTHARFPTATTHPLALPELERNIQDLVYQCLLFGLHVADEPARTAPQVFGRVREHVEHYVKLGIVAAASRLNARVPRINSLPVEMLSEIFRHLSSPDAVRLSHVCRHWRQVALDDPCLWTDVSLGPGTSSWPSAVAEILSRSRQLPISVAVKMPTYNPFRLDVARILAKHMAHVRALHVTLTSPDALDSLQIIFGQPAPLADTLSMNFDRSMRETLDLNPMLLANTGWPALRTVSLFRIRPPAQPSALFRAAQHVSVHLTDMTGLDIQHAYGAFPALRVLHAACARYHNITTAISAPVKRERGQLLALFLDIPSSDLSTVLPRLPCAAIGRIELEWNAQSAAWLLGADARADGELVESVAVLPQAGTSWIVVLKTRSQVRIVRSVPAAHALFLVRDTPAPEVTMPVEFFSRTRVQRDIRKLTLLLGWLSVTDYQRSLDVMLVPRAPRDEAVVQELVFSACLPEEYQHCVRDGLFADSQRRSVSLHMDAVKSFFGAAFPSAKFATTAFKTAGSVVLHDD